MKSLLAACLGLGVCAVAIGALVDDEQPGETRRDRPREVEIEVREQRERDREPETREERRVIRRRVEVRDRDVERKREHAHRERDERAQRDAAIAELRAHLDDLQARRRELAETGRADAAERLGGEIREVAAELERHLAAHRREHDERGDRDELHPEMRAAIHKLEHMRAAIEHLQEAGMNEIAHVVGERAEKLQADIHRSREHIEREHGERDIAAREHAEARRRREHEHADQRELAQRRERELHAAIRDIRREVEELRNEVRELHRRDREMRRDRDLERDRDPAPDRETDNEREPIGERGP